MEARYAALLSKTAVVLHLLLSLCGSATAKFPGARDKGRALFGCIRVYDHDRITSTITTQNSVHLRAVAAVHSSQKELADISMIGGACFVCLILWQQTAAM